MQYDPETHKKKTSYLFEESIDLQLDIISRVFF